MAIATFTKVCSKNVGGNSAVYLTETANIDSITVTSDEVSVVTMDGEETFHEVKGQIDTIIRTEEGEGNASNIFYTHRVEIKFAKPSTELNVLRNALADASPCGIVAIVTDGNGESWLVGYNETDGVNRPLRLVQDALNSGAAPSEEDGQIVTIALEGTSGYVDLPFDDSLKADISGGTADFIDYV